MAYDPATGSVILFGGDDGQAALDGTWSWDGSGWSLLHPAVSPPPRTRALMAYYPGTRRLVLTGGYAMSAGDQAGSEDSDTWSWDGSGWFPEPAGGLPASASSGEGMALATDDASGQLILVTELEEAGCQAAETWHWSGTSWARLHPSTSPTGADGGLLAADLVTGQLDLFATAGGCPGDADQSTALWSWDGATWESQGTSTSGAGPPNPAKMIISGALVASATGPLLVVWSGTYAWDGSTGWAQVADAPGALGVLGDPSGGDERSEEALAFDTARHEVVLFGGNCGLCDPNGIDYLGDTWTYAGRWTLADAGTVTTPTPTPVPTPPPPPQPCPPPTPQGTPELIDDLSMFSPSTGWAEEAGTSTVLHTTAGVQPWTVASPPLSGDQQMLAASFLDGSTAQAITGMLWSCDDQGPPSADLVAWGTQDSGTTWNREGAFSVPDFGGGSLDFVDPQDGWLSVSQGLAMGSSGMAVYQTVDGGTQWSEVAETSVEGSSTSGAAGVIPFGNDKDGAVFIDPSTGWITGSTAGATPVFYVTHDGGVTWNPQALPSSASFVQPGTAPPHFWSSQGGWLQVDNPGGQGSAVYLTTDGGAEWDPVSLPGGAAQLPGSADFIDASDGWLLTFTETSAGAETSQTLWETQDGGTSWTAISSDTAPVTLDFVNADDGWATTTAAYGDAVPALLQTTDGGRTWTAVSPEITGSAASS
jgi:photosystem II stability/assembly factor-like uncharacterized protein